MKDALQVLNYDTWWRKYLNNILPYVIPAVDDDITQKMEVQLEDSSNRIDNTPAVMGKQLFNISSVWLMKEKLHIVFCSHRT